MSSHVPPSPAQPPGVTPPASRVMSVMRCMSSTAAATRSWPCLIAAVLAAVFATSTFAVGPDDLGLSDRARRAFDEHGFVVVPGAYQDFPEAYDALSEKGLPAFITSDSVLRSTDLLVDRVLLTIETDFLYDRLAQLSREMIRLLDEDYLRSSDPAIKDAARRDMAFFAVGLLPSGVHSGPGRA
jgi:hypothetical protein